MSGRFGEYFARLRRERTESSLREFSELNGFDAGNLSKLERGKLPPPRAAEKLAQYAKALRLEEGSTEWYEFFDRAAAERGEIPADVLEDTEIADQLPVLFRTLRGDPVPQEQLQKLLEIIRRS